MTWPTSNPVARELDDFWKESQALWQQYWYEADLDTKMATGQQDYWNSFYNINYRNQKILMFNKILRIINMIQGYQIDNRLDSIIKAADNDPDAGETADQRTAVLNWCMQQDQTYEKISDCFGGSTTCGLNLLHIWMDFREDPENGMIRTERLPFNSFLMDNYWTDPTLRTDCGRIWTRRYITTRELESLIPGIKKDIPYLGKGYAAKDGKFQFLAQNWYQYQQEMYAYDEYWTKDYKTVYKILDTQTGELARWKGTREQFRYLRKFNPNVELIKASVPTVKWHVLVNNHLVYEEQSPYGLDRFPYAASICYHYPEVQNYAYRYQGVVRNIRDSQIELNRRRNRLLDILDAQIQSGLMAKEDALVNPEDAFFQGPGKILFLKQTANIATDIAPIPAPPVAPGWQELISSIEKEIMDIVGPEELFAQNMGAKEMTGVLMKLKMGAGLIGLRNIFDRLNQFQMCVSEIIDDLIVNNFGSGKISRILGKDPSQYFFDQEFSKYNVVVEEGERTSSQRQRQFLDALQLKQMGIPISNKYIIEKSTLAGKKEILDDLAEQEKMQQQIQQTQFQAEMQQAQVLARSLEAKAQSDFAGAKEKEARAVSDIGLARKNAALASYDEGKAAYENAKALHELDEIPENRLIKLIDFLLSMQERQKNLSKEDEEDEEMAAARVGADVKQSEFESKPNTTNT